MIEIMIVVFIVSLLLSIVALEGIKLRKMANEMNTQANLKAIATSFEIYASAHTGVYAPADEDNMEFLVKGKYATEDFITAGPVGNYRFQLGAITPDGYDVRAIAVNPVLADHNYQIVTGAKLLRSDTSSSGDTDFKNFN